MNLSTTQVGIAGVVLGALIWAAAFNSPVTQELGSVNRANEYFATSTAGNSVFGAFTSGRNVQDGPGALGSVVVTGANTGVINFYNATTTNVSKRTGQKATSTILIASIPASMAAGTYTFDAVFSDGLFVDIVSGTAPTTTITYR